MKKPNEINALNALLEILPYLVGSDLRLIESPDDTNSHSPEVDFILESTSGDGLLFAVEHTVVESFKGQTTYVRRSFDIAERINIACKGKLPLDRFFILGLPYRLVESLRKKSIDKFINLMLPWILSSATNLHEDEFRYTKYDDEEILLTCGGSSPEVNGTIFRIPVAPKNENNLTVKSLQLAISHGIAKLAKYKELGHKTILVLENISGIVHPSMLITLEKAMKISNTIDYIIEFVSNRNRMIVSNIWKENETLYSKVPYSRRFSRKGGNWAPLEAS